MNHVIHTHDTLGGIRPQSAAGIFARLAAPFAVWRQRRALAQLPAHLRRDLGLTEGDVHREVSRPIWDVPGHWIGWRATPPFDAHLSLGKNYRIAEGPMSGLS